MGYLAHSIAELHQGRKLDDFGWQSIPVYEDKKVDRERELMTKYMAVSLSQTLNLLLTLKGLLHCFCFLSLFPKILLINRYL